MVDIITMEDCASNYGVFKVVGTTGTHTVTLSGSEGPAHCDCKAFKFSRQRTCKHIKQVYTEACLYNPQWHDAKEAPKLRPTEYTYDAFTGNTVDEVVTKALAVENHMAAASAEQAGLEAFAVKVGTLTTYGMMWYNGRDEDQHRS